jgi:N6-L-threonylcarbamoyladenine synthase
MTNLTPARILAIETSCDETAAAVIENGRALLSSTVASQMEIHARYGGVYPEVAARQHVLSILPVIEQTLSQAHLALADINAIAATRGPGLAGSLVVGMNAAKGLALGAGLPLVGVNHLEGHIYSAWVYNDGDTPPPEPQFPLMALLVSGGHTELNLMDAHLSYKRLGATLDDAAGEAFDKVARLQISARLAGRDLEFFVFRSEDRGSQRMQEIRWQAPACGRSGCQFPGGSRGCAIQQNPGCGPRV